MFLLREFHREYNVLFWRGADPRPQDYGPSFFRLKCFFFQIQETFRMICLVLLLQHNFTFACGDFPLNPAELFSSLYSCELLILINGLWSNNRDICLWFVNRTISFKRTTKNSYYPVKMIEKHINCAPRNLNNFLVF